MPSFGFGFVRPGVYVQQKDVVIPSPAPGVLRPAIIGTGTLNKTTLVSGIERQSQSVFLRGSVDIAAGASVNGDTFSFTLDGVAKSITFSGTDPIAAATISTAINTAALGVVASIVAVGPLQYLQLTAVDKIIVIGTGTAANAALGFTAGQSTVLYDTFSDGSTGEAVATVFAQGNVDIAAGASVTGDTLVVTIANTEHTVTFTTSDPIAAAIIVSQINAVIGLDGTASLVVSGAENYLRITAAPGKDSITLGNGTAHAALGLATSGTTAITNAAIIDIEQASYLNDERSGGVARDGFFITKVVTGNQAVYPFATLGDYIVVWTGVGAARPAAGLSYSVQWITPKVDDDFLPLTYSSDALSAIIDFYGEPDPDRDLTIENSASAGAQISVSNGAGELVVCQIDTRDSVDPTNPTSGELYVGAVATLTKLESVDAYCLVPMLPVDTNLSVSNQLTTGIKNHVTNMSAILIRKERIALLGVPANTDITPSPAPVDVYKALATTLKSARICVMAPSQCSFTFNSEPITLDGSYIAAAVSGIICNGNVDAGEPITGKVIAVDAVVDKFTDNQKNKLGNAGVLMCVPTPEVPSPSILLDLTTDPANIITSSIKIMRIKDTLTKVLRVTLHNLYVNTRNLGTSTLASIGSTVQTILLQFLNSAIITEYRNLKVTLNTQDPRQVDVEFEFKPTFEVNYIFVKFTTTAF